MFTNLEKNHPSLVYFTKIFSFHPKYIPLICLDEVWQGWGLFWETKGLSSRLRGSIVFLPWLTSHALKVDRRVRNDRWKIHHHHHLCLGSGDFYIHKMYKSTLHSKSVPFPPVVYYEMEMHLHSACYAVMNYLCHAMRQKANLYNKSIKSSSNGWSMGAV